MENNQEILFMAGFPRAGSTLLMNILAQNPKFHGTSTSGLINSVILLRDNWRNNPNYLAANEEYIYEKIKTMLRGTVKGFYENELNNNIIPIDKNRFWTTQTELLDEIFNTRVKFIYPIRNVVDCLISFEKMMRKSSINKRGSDGNIRELTTLGRAEGLLKDDGVFGTGILGLRELIYRKEWDRLILVPFDDLLNYPVPSLKRLYHQLGMEYFEHDVNNIKQIIVEHDTFHGYAPNSLHKIKEGKLEPPNPRDLTIFDEKFINEIENNRYNDITEFIKINTAK